MMRNSAAPAPAHGGGADDVSPIEGLVEMMRGRARPQETETIYEDDERQVKGTRGPANGGRLGPNDEATIQRKSTNLDDEPAGPPETAGSSSLVRSGGKFRGLQTI